jgi:zinc-binding in reverse transcriptase
MTIQRNMILTKDNLIKRDWREEGKCVFCSSDLETIDHLFC